MRPRDYRNPTQELLDKYGIAMPPCGAESPGGWLPLIEELIKDLIDLGWDKDCQQVKEKFGGLRFYIGATTPEITERISKAEVDSYKICCACGVPAERRGGMYALCEAHKKE